MACKPGDLVFIPFPYASLETSKKRSVLALTSPDRHADFIGLAITSVEPQDQAIQLTAADLVQGALPKTSWVRLDKVFTLSESSIVKVFGEVSPSTLHNVLQGLCSVVGYVRN